MSVLSHSGYLSRECILSQLQCNLSKQRHSHMNFRLAVTSGLIENTNSTQSPVTVQVNAASTPMRLVRCDHFPVPGKTRDCLVCSKREKKHRQTTSVLHVSSMHTPILPCLSYTKELQVNYICTQITSTKKKQVNYNIPPSVLLHLV